MHIAIIGTRGIPAKYGGFETCAEEISIRIANQGHKVSVYCRKGNHDDSLATYGGVNLIHLPFMSGKITETFSHTILAVIHSLFIKADILLIMNAANGSLCILPRMLGKKVVINVDGLEWRRKKWGKAGRLFYLLSEKISSKIATRIVSDAIGIKDYYISRYNTESTYIAYGAEIESSKTPELLKQYKLQPDSYFFIGSRLEPENNADIAVRAMAYLNTDLKLVIAGGANYDSDYIKSLRSVGDERIQFLGPVYADGHMKELHCNCFAYIHGNEVGGTNPALLKAMGYGNMVLATNNIFNVEVLADAGMIFDKDPQILASIMQDLIDHPNKRESFQVKAKERIKYHYTWDKIASQYLQLFSECIEGEY
jgi:glycosyltransferase involved in cell wall biosynthesis